MPFFSLRHGRWGKARGLGQNGGYIVAIDVDSEEELWLQRVYEVHSDGDMEPDEQDVFITRLSLADSGRTLLVENERGERYALDLATRAVSRR